jgi:hypothetical protein
MKFKFTFLPLIIVFGLIVNACNRKRNESLHTNINNLYLLSNAKSRSISPENPTGGKGKGARATQGTGAHASRYLGKGWKVSPSLFIKAGQTDTLANIDGPGAIKQIWMTPSGDWENEILRIYWDGEKNPSVEVPIGYFFAAGWQQFHQVSSLAVTHNPGSGLNSYWVMPFRKHCTITIENNSDKLMILFYQINYVLAKVPRAAAYFHAQYRQQHPVTFKEPYTIVDSIEGKGQYVGTYMTIETKSDGWWGEGEAKFYIDGDTSFPTISFTGTEDYFNGSYDFYTTSKKEGVHYTDFTTPYGGFYALNNSHKPGKAGERFGMYRWHIHAPIRFDHSLRVTIQDLGAQRDSDGVYYWPRQDNISSVAYWYQTEPHTPFPKLPSKKALKSLDKR